MNLDDRAILALSTIRREWEQAAEGNSLLEIKAAVGLLLDDVIKALDCTPDERLIILGADLTVDLT